MASRTLSAQEILLVRNYMAEAIGVSIGENKAYLIDSRLSPIVTDTGARDLLDLIAKAKADPTRRLHDRIVDALTTHETFWFRDERAWTKRASKETALRPIMEALCRFGVGEQLRGVRMPAAVVLIAGHAAGRCREAVTAFAGVACKPAGSSFRFPQPWERAVVESTSSRDISRCRSCPARFT